VKYRKSLGTAIHGQLDGNSSLRIELGSIDRLEVKDYTKGSGDSLEIDPSDATSTTWTETDSPSDNTEFNAETDNLTTAENIASAIDSVTDYTASAVEESTGENPYVSVDYTADGYISGASSSNKDAWEFVANYSAIYSGQVPEDKRVYPYIVIYAPLTPGPSVNAYNADGTRDVARKPSFQLNLYTKERLKQSKIQNLMDLVDNALSTEFEYEDTDVDLDLRPKNPTNGTPTWREEEDHWWVWMRWQCIILESETKN